MSKKDVRVAPAPNDPDPFSMPGTRSWKSVLAELHLGQNVAHWRSKASANSSYGILLSQAAKIPGMSKLGQEALHAIAKEMDDIPCEKGDTIIRQGDLVSNTFYIVANGTFEADVDGTVVKTYKGESFFGDVALLKNEPRIATVRCVEDGLLWALDRATFRTNIIGVTLRQAADQIGFLAKMDPATLVAMVDDMFEVKCTPGQTIITEGDPGDNFFLVEDGKFEAWLADVGRDKPVKTYEAGSGFGELALLQNVPRAASVQCVEAGRLWAIDRLAFRKRTLGYMVVQASTSRNVFGEEEDEEADHLAAAEADEEATSATEEEMGNRPPAETVEATTPASSEEVAAPATTADGKRVVAITFESDKEKRARKSLRMSPKLNDQLGLLWDAADIHLTRVYRASYLNYHLSLSRFILRSQDEEKEFDAIDAFEAALIDWERDTDQGSLPAVHQQALLDSAFEVVDLYTNTLKEKEYLTFAKGLVRHGTVKVKEEIRLRKLDYIGNRRHTDDAKAVRLGALSQLLSDSGASLHRGDQGLPQLLAVYHMLDVDDDGWITEADFKSALLELTVDPTDLEKGPLRNGEPIDLLGASRSGLTAAKQEDVPDAAFTPEAGERDAPKAERRKRRASLKGSEVKRSQADGHLAELKAEAAQSKQDAAAGKTARRRRDDL